MICLQYADERVDRVDITLQLLADKMMVSIEDVKPHFSQLSVLAKTEK